MSTQSLKKWALLLTLWLALHVPTLKAQLLGPYGTSPITFGVDVNGLLSDTGTFGTGTLSLSGAGTRMIWYPGKGAFRAGSVNGTQWDDANIGAYSTASGYNAKASGFGSVAFGGGTASGPFSFASGGAVASGIGATAFGSSTAIGPNSIAAGSANTASAYYSTAFGRMSLASGRYATASGYGATASQIGAVALGLHVTASGLGAAAFGLQTTASADYSFVVGTHNVGGGAPTSWIPTDPLFEVGNGTSSSAKADAFVVYKNGNSQTHGTFRCAAGGDLSMGSFTAGTAP